MRDDAAVSLSKVGLIEKSFRVGSTDIAGISLRPTLPFQATKFNHYYSKMTNLCSNCLLANLRTVILANIDKCIFLFKTNNVIYQQDRKLIPFHFICNFMPEKSDPKTSKTNKGKKQAYRWASLIFVSRLESR